MTLRDRLIWKENKAKKFLVKTAYQEALRLHHPQSGEHSQARLDQKMWKRIWFINVPPKVRTFIWCAWSNILPTKANLLRKKVQVDPTCSVCGQHEETTGHIRCGHWLGVGFRRKAPRCQTSSFLRDRWWRDYQGRNLSYGLWLHGCSRMHKTVYTSNTHRPIRLLGLVEVVGHDAWLA